MGRSVTYEPSSYIPEILQWIADGKTLRDYSRQEGRPSYGTVYDWIERDSDFASRFARARESGEDQIAQECLEIADESPVMTIEGEGWSKTCIDGAGIQRNRLRVDTRLKLLAKWNPKKYGDKLQHTGADGEGPVEIALADAISQARKRAQK